MAVMRKKLGWVLYVLTLLSALAVFLFAKTSPGNGEVGAIFHGVFIVVGLWAVAAFALVSLVTGWPIKFIRYSILGIAGLIACVAAFNFGTELYSEQQGKKRQAAYDRDRDVAQRTIRAYRGRYLKSRSDPEDVASLLAEIEEELKREGIDPECRSGGECNRQLDYSNFKGGAILYLGIFVDEKFMDSINEGSKPASFYTGFYEANESAFTDEVHFSKLLNAMIEKSDNTNTVHRTTLNGLSGTLANRGYIEAYLQLVPLTPPVFSESYGVQKQFLKGALTLAEKTGDDRAVIAVLDHSIYNFPSEGSDCELKKFNDAFDFLKGSKKLDAYIDILFSQMSQQCRSTQWRAEYEVDEEVYCYLQKNEDWIRQYTSDGRIREKLLADIDCTAAR